MDNKEIKVCHITSAHSRYDGRIYQRACVAAAKNGFKTVLLVNDDKSDEIKGNVVIHTVQFDKTRVKRFLFASARMRKYALRENADIYHLHDPELLPLALKLKRSGKVVIFDSHELYYYQIQVRPYLTKSIRRTIAKIYKIYEKHVLSKIDAVIVPAPANGQNYFENIARRTEFIDNVPWIDGYDFENYMTKRIPRVCCYTGGITMVRAAKEMIDAAIKSQTKLILAGPMENKVAEYINSLDCDDKEKWIEYRGLLDKNGVKEIYKETSVGLAILKNQGQYAMADNLPTKAYEYMACGIPVILSDFPYAKKIVEQYGIGCVVDPNNVETIASAISALAQNPLKAKKMGENGRKAAEERFSFNYEEKKLIRLYNDLMGL